MKVGEWTKEDLTRYIVGYQNYEGAKVINQELNFPEEEIRGLVGDKLYRMYSMDPKKRFAMKTRRGFWKD